MGSEQRRIPTGVADFDSIIKGGMPSGSLVLLLGEIGAGATEFALTSAARLSIVMQRPRSADFMMGGTVNDRALPNRILYVTFTRTREDILRELRLSFNEEYADAFERNVEFKDFSSNYFRQSVVPRSWTSGGGGLFANEDGTVLEGLVDFLEANAPGNMVIMDSLTDLALNQRIEPGDLVALLRGMQRISKVWNGLIYMVLTKDVLEDRQQKVLMDCVDGTLSFDWSKFTTSSMRQRYMHVEKFMSILPHLDKQRIARFATMVTAQNGLVVIDTERIA
jgi:KaiC/GvpD/RAD55 family RecA-like ATPase